MEFVEIVSQVFKVEIVPHSLIYPKLEAAALEAFKSNILLNSQHTTILSRYEFKSLEETLRRILAEA